MPFEVEFYESPEGSCPVEEFILKQDVKMQAKIYRVIELLEMKGNNLREPYSKFLGDGIFELRAKQGGDITRVLYFFVLGSKVVLTNGFVKKTQKTPRSEIELAKKRRDDYVNREVNSDVEKL